MPIKSSKGFSTVETILVVIATVVIGCAGWFVWQRNHKIEPQTDANQQQAQRDKREEESKTPPKTISLLGGTINFTDDGTWKVTTGGYYSIESGHCGRGTDFDESCLDHKMLIPANETFTNPDQFQVNISVFKGDEVTSASALGAWIDLNVSPGGSNPETSYSKINGNDVYRYKVTYDENDVRLVYGVLLENKIVIVVQSNFFKGDHNSYKSSTDYMPFIARVDSLAATIR